MAKVETRENLLRKITSSRSSLLLIMVFTVVNLLMVWFDAGSYFLFSISVPYYLTSLGKGLDNGFAATWDVNGTYTITGLVISAVILVVFLLCWLLSKKKTGWLTVAFVLMIVDTVALALFTFALYENPAVNLVDFLLHAWMIWDLFKGSSAGKKLKKLPAETPEEVDLSAFYGSASELSDGSDHIDL